MVKKKATKRGTKSGRGAKKATRSAKGRFKASARKSTKRSAKKSSTKSASRSGGRATAKKGMRRAPARPSGATTRPKKAATGSAGEMYGEGSWKADEEYRQGIKEFSQTRGSEELAREAAQDVEDEDVPQSGKTKSEDESEW